MTKEEQDNPFADDPEYQAMKQAAKEEINRERNDWVNVMNTDSGKRLVVRILQSCGHMRSVFDVHNSKMSKNAGRAEIGFEIQNKLAEYTPNEFVDIMQNAAKLFANDD